MDNGIIFLKNLIELMHCFFKKICTAKSWATARATKAVYSYLPNKRGHQIRGVGKFSATTIRGSEIHKRGWPKKILML